MATANATVKKVLDHLNQKIGTGGGVVDSWSDGNGNWWRKFSDGWIEQGGPILVSATSDVSFNTSFSNTSYAFLVCSICSEAGEQGSWDARELSGHRSTSSTKCYVDAWEGGNGRYGTWYACGY